MEKTDLTWYMLCIYKVHQVFKWSNLYRTSWWSENPKNLQHQYGCNWLRLDAELNAREVNEYKEQCVAPGIQQKFYLSFRIKGEKQQPKTASLWSRWIQPELDDFFSLLLCQPSFFESFQCFLHLYYPSGLSVSHGQLSVFLSGLPSFADWLKCMNSACQLKDEQIELRSLFLRSSRPSLSFPVPTGELDKCGKETMTDNTEYVRITWMYLTQQDINATKKKRIAGIYRPATGSSVIRKPVLRSRLLRLRQQSKTDAIRAKTCYRTHSCKAETDIEWTR